MKRKILVLAAVLLALGLAACGNNYAVVPVHRFDFIEDFADLSHRYPAIYFPTYMVFLT